MRASTQQQTTRPDVSVRPLERIVVGIDFSEMSLATAQWVGRHLGRDATLTLVHVIADPLLPNVLQWRSHRQSSGEGPFRTRMESVRGALRGLAEVMGAAKTGVEVRVGDPAVQLATYADIVDADLVVVGGSSRFHATTDRLLRQLTQAALIARNPTPPTTVLAVLASDVTAPVLDFARVVAMPSGARVVPLRLSDEKSGGSIEAGQRLPRQIATSRRAPSEQVRMILDVAREQRADMIVVGGSAAATGADDMARVLARTATCSVLVVPYTARARRGVGVPMTPARAQSVGTPNDEDDIPSAAGWP